MVEESAAAHPGEPRVSTGIASLDAMLVGGLVARRPYLVVGPSGTGKTTLGLQFLREGVRRGERVLLVTLEEPPNEARVNHRGLAPDLDRVDVFDAIPDIMRYERTPFKDIASVRHAVPFGQIPLSIRVSPELASVEVTITALEQMLRTEVIRKGYTRLVVDSLTALQYFCMKGFDPIGGAQAFLRFLSELRVTTILTVEAPLEDVETPERMLARGEIRLFRWELDGVTVRAVGVEKFRGSAHDVRLHPYRIGPQGIDINLEMTISRDTRQIIEPIVRHPAPATAAPIVAPFVSSVTPLIDEVRDLVLLGAEVEPARAEIEAALAATNEGHPEDAQKHLSRVSSLVIALVDTLNQRPEPIAPDNPGAAAAFQRILARADSVRTGVPPTNLPPQSVLQVQLGALLSLLPPPPAHEPPAAPTPTPVAASGPVAKEPELAPIPAPVAPPPEVVPAVELAPPAVPPEVEAPAAPVSAEPAPPEPAPVRAEPIPTRETEHALPPAAEVMPEPAPEAVPEEAPPPEPGVAPPTVPPEPAPVATEPVPPEPTPSVAVPVPPPSVAPAAVSGVAVEVTPPAPPVSEEAVVPTTPEPVTRSPVSPKPAPPPTVPEARPPVRPEGFSGAPEAGKPSRAKPVKPLPPPPKPRVSVGVSPLHEMPVPTASKRGESVPAPPPLPKASTPEWLTHPPPPAPTAPPVASAEHVASGARTPHHEVSAGHAAVSAPKRRRKPAAATGGKKTGPAARAPTAPEAPQEAVGVHAGHAPEAPHAVAAPGAPAHGELEPGAKGKRRAPRKRKAPPVVSAEVEPMPKEEDDAPGAAATSPGTPSPAVPPPEG